MLGSGRGDLGAHPNHISLCSEAPPRVHTQVYTGKQQEMRNSMQNRENREKYLQETPGMCKSCCPPWLSGIKGGNKSLPGLMDAGKLLEGW